MPPATADRGRWFVAVDRRELGRQCGPGLRQAITLAVAFLLGAGWGWAAEAAKAVTSYEIVGQIQPRGRAFLSLHSATTPFTTTAQSDGAGRFHFRRLVRGAYTLTVLLPGLGEARQTIDIGPSLADSKRRVAVTLNMNDPALVSVEALQRRVVVSAKDLTIPLRARREFDEGQKKLSQKDTAAAIEHLKLAVAEAPQFWIAWNALGTIAYQTHDVARAETCFREALKQNPAAFEPTVNLGGVLLTSGKWREALAYNQRAVAARPHDALANSQLGMNYYFLLDLEQAVPYLSVAKQIDPGHFSYPQLIL
ncbi:MAG TPA: tetratricopeptide repeat protein, partial [Terriglobales bacterium]|nr:tetratricopeptide repeat protein [Terriglobales bacterium]